MIGTGWWLFLVGSPVKLAVWIGNRLATWTGTAVAWQKLKHSPNRSRVFFKWLLLINAVSLLVLVVALYILRHR